MCVFFICIMYGKMYEKTHPSPSAHSSESAFINMTLKTPSAAPPSECTFGNETYVDGELIRSYPERCLQLRCEVEELTEAPFYQEHIVEISPNSSCGCES